MPFINELLWSSPLRGRPPLNNKPSNLVVIHIMIGDFIIITIPPRLGRPPPNVTSSSQSHVCWMHIRIICWCIYQWSGLGKIMIVNALRYVLILSPTSKLDTSYWLWVLTCEMSNPPLSHWLSQTAMTCSTCFLQNQLSILTVPCPGYYTMPSQIFHWVLVV